MYSPFPHYSTSSRMGIYDPINQMGMWEDFKENDSLNTPTSVIVEVDAKQDSQSEENSNGTLGPSNNYDREAAKPVDKKLSEWCKRSCLNLVQSPVMGEIWGAKSTCYRVLSFIVFYFTKLCEHFFWSFPILKRLAQNREAARKSRLRKKAYVQQLETSRLKLLQLEQELEHVKQQGLYTAHLGCSQNVRSGIAAFERGYGQWVEEQNRQTFKLRNVLESHLAGDDELALLVSGSMKLYSDLFRMKSVVAESDVFYLMTGMWRSSSERFFLWIGGFRPSDLLKQVLLPQLDPVEQQYSELCNLRQSCQQAEDALSQGMIKLQQSLAEAVAATGGGDGFNDPQVVIAMHKLETVVCFVNQADHLRLETLQQMARILTIRQQARALVALGDYFQSLRALSQLWEARPSKHS